MKRRGLNIFLNVIIVLLIVAMVAYYLYDVLYLGTDYKENLVKVLVVVIGLLGTLFKRNGGADRKALSVYEKTYAKELGSAYKNDPKLRKKLLRACRAYNESKYNKALKILHGLLKVTEVRRDTIPVFLFIALCYEDAGIPNEAIKAYNELLKIDPCNAQAHSNLGLRLVSVGDFEKALEHYNRAVEFDPHNYYAYTNRANYYFRVQAYKEAIEDARKALTIKNNGAEAASLLAILYAMEGDEENRKKYYHLAIASGKRPIDLNKAIQYYLNEVD